MKALFVEILGDGTNVQDGRELSVQDEVFTVLRRMTRGNPSCRNREERLDYICDRTRGSMILLDVCRIVHRPGDVDDAAWTSNITEQIRLLWEHTAVPVVVCFRGVKDVVELEEDPRQHIFCFPELSRETSVAFMKKLLSVSQDAALPEWCEQRIEAAPRNFPMLWRHAAMMQYSVNEGQVTEKLLEFTLQRSSAHIGRAFIDTDCPDTADFVRQLAKNEAVPSAVIVKQCHDNVGAPAALTAAGILRPASSPRGGPDRYRHLCQCDHLAKAMLAKVEKEGCRPAVV